MSFDRRLPNRLDRILRIVMLQKLYSHELAAVPVLPSLAAAELRDDLRTRIDDDDRMLVTEIRSWAYQALMNGNRFKALAG
jgi:hypothetical protein